MLPEAIAAPKFFAGGAVTADLGKRALSESNDAIVLEPKNTWKLCPAISVKNSELPLQKFLTRVIYVTGVCDLARGSQANILIDC
jgi:hypothetical protein